MADRKASDIRSMQLLWNQVFRDEWDYLEDFFDSFFPHPVQEMGSIWSGENRGLYIRDGDRVISQLFMIPYTMDGRKEKIVYLYALATHPAYRGRGLMDQLIQRALNMVEERGEAGAFLIPAEESLKKYYEKYGFCSTQKHVKGDAEEVESDNAGYPAIILSKPQREFFHRSLKREGMREEEWQTPGMAPMIWGNEGLGRLGVHGILT